MLIAYPMWSKNSKNLENHDCSMPIRASQKKKLKKEVRIESQNKRGKRDDKIRDETMESKGFSIEQMVIQNSV